VSKEGIIQQLEKHNEMTAIELAEKLQISLMAVWKNLRGLLKEMEVEKRTLTKEEIEDQGKHFTGRQIIWHLTENG